MTEDEAKTKSCFRAATFGANQQLADGPGPHCIGSWCMAWRWVNDYERRWDLPRDQPPEGEGWQRLEAIGGVAHWVRQTKTPHGFCGLVGTPQ